MGGGGGVLETVNLNLVYIRKGVSVIVFSFYKSSSNIESHEIKENHLLYLL